LGLYGHLSQGRMQVRSVDEMPRMCPELVAQSLRVDPILQLSRPREELFHNGTFDSSNILDIQSHPP